MYSRTHNVNAETMGQVVSVESLYVVLYGLLLGASVWAPIVQGTISHLVLPRAEFRTLQAKTFPWYFGSASAVSTTLLITWVYTHPDALTYFLRGPLRPDALQAWSLFIAAGCSVAQYFYVGPETTRVMERRADLEKEEGKPYNDPMVSDELKAVNETFFNLHALTQTTNMLTVLALVFHGLWIGAYGVHGY